MHALLPIEDRNLEPFVTALWGASGRGEATAGSDLDVLLWTPQGTLTERKSIVAAVQKAGSGVGQYVDLLEYDGSRTLHEWARSTATDLQAVLFATSVNGDAELAEEFMRLQSELWLDQQLRAREVWLLSAEMLRRPEIMSQAGYMHRPEKFTPGATRSFTALGEIQSLVSGAGSARATYEALAAVERELSLENGALVSGYERSLEIRLEVEAGRDPSRYVDEWKRLAQVAKNGLKRYMLRSVSWLQSHSGVSTEIAAAHLESLFHCIAKDLPSPQSRDPETELMIRAFNSNEPLLGSLVMTGRVDWTAAFAATANPKCGAATLTHLVFPPFSVDAHDWRNVWLWSLRHPNLPREVAARFLNEPGHREMDYSAARIALNNGLTTVVLP